MKQIIYILIYFIVVNTLPTFAQPGALDPAFNGTGKAITDLGIPKEVSIDGMARQTDGNLIVAGRYGSSSPAFVYLVRYHTDGSLDNSFGVGGQVITAIKVGTYSVAIAIQSDGKIVVAGSLSGDLAVIRFNSNGTTDNTFSSDGIATVDFRGDYDGASAIVIQTDGKIVAAGYSYLNNSSDFAIARFTPNGTLDNTFSSDGKLVVEIINTSDGASSLALQGDGKIVVAGTSVEDNVYRYKKFAVIRLNVNGSPDFTFGFLGIRTTDVEGFVCEATSVKIQRDGKIVVAGSRYRSRRDDPGIYDKANFAVVRYNTNGNLDTAFGRGGKVNAYFNDDQSDFATSSSLMIQPDGKLVLAGKSSSGYSAMRFNADGNLDSSFNYDGKVTYITPYSHDCIAILQPDGKIVMEGASRSARTNEIILAVIRYSSDGSLDGSFGSETVPGKSNDKIWATTIQQDGKVVVAGESLNSEEGSRLALARYNTNGRLDSSFNLDGLLAKTYPGELTAFDVKVQADGKIVVAGRMHNGANYDFAVARFTAKGSVDNTFSGDGLVTTTFATGSTSSEQVRSIALQPDGKIVAAGCVVSGTNYDFAIARYNKDGSLDNTFSFDGKLTKSIGKSNDYGRSVIIQPDNKIVVAGYTWNGTNYDIAILRLNPDGTTDNNFSGDGIVTTDINGRDDFGLSTILQTDLKILVAGNTYNGTDWDFAVLRYNINGTPDNTFSGDGKEITTINGNSNDKGSTIALQTNGNIVVAGYSYKGANNDFGIVRYKATGKVDSSFGVKGRVLTDFGYPDDYGTALAMQTDDKIILAGYSNNDFALARYLTSNTTPLPPSQGNLSRENMLTESTGHLSAYVTPNPATQNAKLVISASAKTPIEVYLINAVGKTDKIMKLEFNGSNAYDFPVHNLMPGTYFITLKQGNLVARTKLIVGAR